MKYLRMKINSNSVNNSDKYSFCTGSDSSYDYTIGSRDPTYYYRNKEKKVSFNLIEINKVKKPYSILKQFLFSFKIRRKMKGKIYLLDKIPYSYGIKRANSKIAERRKKKKKIYNKKFYRVNKKLDNDLKSRKKLVTNSVWCKELRTAAELYLKKKCPKRFQQYLDLKLIKNTIIERHEINHKISNKLQNNHQYVKSILRVKDNKNKYIEKSFADQNFTFNSKYLEKFSNIKYTYEELNLIDGIKNLKVSMIK